MNSGITYFFFDKPDPFFIIHSIHGTMIRSLFFIQQISAAYMNGNRIFTFQFPAFLNNIFYQLGLYHKILPDRCFNIFKIKWALPEAIQEYRVLELKELLVKMKIRLLVNMLAQL